MATTRTASRKELPVSLIHASTQAPVRPGVSPLTALRWAGSRSTIEVIHGSDRDHAPSWNSQRTRRVRVWSIPSTAVGAGVGSARCGGGDQDPVDGPPRQAVLGGDVAHRPVRGGHCRGHLHLQPDGQPRPGRQRSADRGERALRAVGLRADEPPFTDPPDQPRRPVRQVLHPRDRPADLPARDHPTGRSSRPGAVAFCTSTTRPPSGSACTSTTVNPGSANNKVLRSVTARGRKCWIA
jgi:hypothetical protein